MNYFNPYPLCVDNSAARAWKSQIAEALKERKWLAREALAGKAEKGSLAATPDPKGAIVNYFAAVFAPRTGAGVRVAARRSSRKETTDPEAMGDYPRLRTHYQFSA